MRCNERIKFAAVLDRALGLGFDAVATGHYARIVDGRLHRARDEQKDQSYVLAVLRPDQIAGAMFPLGESRKGEVREEAARRGLGVAEKPDSHDICFIPSGDTAGWLRSRLGEAPGDIVDEAGEVLGRHEGTYGFTVGQRKGLNIGRPAPDGKPRYVLSVSPVDRTVTVGSADRLEVSRIECGAPTWCGDVPTGGPIPALAQVRAHAEPVRCTAMLDGDRLVIDLADVLAGVAPGQTLALYDGDRVLGSATIERAA